MGKCAYCGSTIFGGVRDQDQRYCNDKCLQNSYVLNAAQQIPANLLNEKVEELFRGNCPRCQARGPVDIYKSHSVWSALILTRSVTTPHVCCRSCATKSQLCDLFFSLFCGWWGIPWGLILTPVQITRNLVELCGGPDGSKPSAALRRLVQVNLGAQLMSNRHKQTLSSTPPILPKR